MDTFNVKFAWAKGRRPVLFAHYGFYRAGEEEDYGTELPDITVSLTFQIVVYVSIMRH